MGRLVLFHVQAFRVKLRICSFKCAARTHSKLESKVDYTATSLCQTLLAKEFGVILTAKFVTELHYHQIIRNLNEFALLLQTELGPRDFCVILVGLSKKKNSPFQKSLKGC